MKFLLAFLLFTANSAYADSCSTQLTEDWDMVDAFIEANVHMPFSQYGIAVFLVTKYLLHPIPAEVFARPATPEEIQRVARAAIKMHRAYQVKPFNIHEDSRAIDADERAGKLLKRVKDRVLLILNELPMSTAHCELFKSQINIDYINHYFSANPKAREDWTALGHHLHEVFESQKFSDMTLKFKKRFASAAHSADISVRASAPCLCGIFDHDLTVLFNEMSRRLKGDKLETLLRVIPLGRPL